MPMLLPWGSVDSVHVGEPVPGVFTIGVLLPDGVPTDVPVPGTPCVLVPATCVGGVNGISVDGALVVDTGWTHVGPVHPY